MADNDARNLAARADFCRLLAACYYEPGPEFAEENLFDAMREAAGGFDAELATRAGRLAEGFAAVPLQDLLVEYTRLFLGPVDAPARPYGSLWRDADKGLMTDSTMAVQQLYAEGGFDLAEDFRELPDHIAAELEFLYALLFKACRAARDGESDEVATVRTRLMREHLGQWAAPFADALAASARLAYFRELAGLTRRFVSLESQRVADA
jgi:TorA maturation chaperone TorD